MKLTVRLHTNFSHLCLLSLLAFAVLTVSVSMRGALAGDESGSAQSSNFSVENDKVISELHYSDESLHLVLLNLGRQSGVKILIDEDVPNKKISDSFDGLRVSQVLQSLSKTHQLAVEQVTPSTLLVKRADVGSEISQATHAGTVATDKNITSNMTAPAAFTQPSSIQPSSTPPVPIQFGSKPPGSTPSGSSTPTQSSTPAPTPTEMTSIASFKPDKPLVLTGGVQLSERRPAVPKEFRLGSIISTEKIKSLQKLEPDNIWSRIPNWAGGQWKHQSMTAYYRYNYKQGTKDFAINSFVSKGMSDLGYLADRKGNMWEWDRAHYWAMGEGSTYLVLDYHQALETRYKDETQFTIVFHGIRVVIDKATHKCINVAQTEAVQTYTCPEPDVMKIASSIKTFDEDGQPQSLQKGIGFSYRIKGAGFTKNSNIRNYFAQYLTSHGLAELIPGM